MMHVVCLAEVHETMLQQPPHVGDLIMQSATACTVAQPSCAQVLLRPLSC